MQKGSGMSSFDSSLHNSLLQSERAMKLQTGGLLPLTVRVVRGHFTRRHCWPGGALLDSTSHKLANDVASQIWLQVYLTCCQASKHLEGPSSLEL